MSSVTVFSVEHALSARASCKKCKQKLEKGVLRWCKRVEGEDFGTMKSYFHVGCCPAPVRKVLDISEVEGLEDISVEERESVAQALVNHYKPKEKVKRGHPDLEVEFKTSSKKQKKQMDDDGVIVDVDDITVEFSKKSVADLKDLLRINKQMISGTKKELVVRVTDGVKNGRLPVCPACGHGILRLSSREGLVECGGYFDEEIGMRIPCKFTKPFEDVTRLPWLTEREEEETPNAQAENSDNVQVSKKVSQALDALAESGIKPKEAAKLLVKTARENGVLIPEIESAANQRAGVFLMRNKLPAGGFDGVAAYKDMAAELGTVVGHEETLAKKARSRPEAQVPENSRIADFIDELAELEAKVKEGDNYKFKVTAMKKACIAIRQATFKITTGKQISAGKQKLAGVGKSTGLLVDEFLANGETDRMLMLRQRVATL